VDSWEENSESHLLECFCELVNREERIMSEVGAVDLTPMMSEAGKARINSTPPPDTSGTSRFWQRLKAIRRSTSYNRLSEALPPFRLELENLIKNQPTAGGSCNYQWQEAALCLLERAEQALRDNEPELGWRCFKAATRLELYGLYNLPGAGFAQKARAIYDEGTAKLRSWRKSTIQYLLEKDGKFNESPPVENAVRAAEILHEHEDNVYEKLSLLQRQLSILSLIAALSVIAWVCLAPPLRKLQAGDPFPLDTREFILAVVLFGVMGAIVSGLLSSVQ
jgi:hypothetical protein